MSSSASRWYLSLGVLALVLLAIGFLPISRPLEDDTNTSGAPNSPIISPTPVAAPNDDTPLPLGPIGNGTVITQDFPAAGTEITSLALFLGTGKPISQGAMSVTIQTQQHGQWTPITTQTIDEARLKDKTFSALSFEPPLPVMRGQIVRIALAAEPGADVAVTWYANPAWNTPDFPLFVNGDRQQGAGIIHVSYARATGHVFQMIGPLWDRATIFLDPMWQVVLALGVVALVGGIAVAVRIVAD